MGLDNEMRVDRFSLHVSYMSVVKGVYLISTGVRYISEFEQANVILKPGVA